MNEQTNDPQRQGIGGEEARDWLLGKIDHVLRAHDIYDDDGAADIASDIADAVLTEAPLSDGPALTTVAAVTEAYTPEGQATWWRSWARNPDRRAEAEAGVLAVWSGHEDDLSASGAGLGGTTREQIAQEVNRVAGHLLDPAYCRMVADAVLALRPVPAPDEQVRADLARVREEAQLRADVWRDRYVRAEAETEAIAGDLAAARAELAAFKERHALDEQTNPSTRTGTTP